MNVTTNNTCAVAGCTRRGKAQTCPHDGQRHHHGRVHYGSNPASSLTFRDGGWFLLCDEHYTIVAAERRAWEQGIAYERRRTAGQVVNG